MVRTLLVRGMLVGILAGMLSSGFAWLFGEPQVDHAIAFEEQIRQLAGDAPEQELVSRTVQSTVGLLTGVVVYGCAFGGIFALVFAYAHGRLGRGWSPRATAAVLAMAAFMVLVLVPQIKYPASPPAAGNPDTIGLRTALYFAMLALSVASAVTAFSTGRSLVVRLGTWNAALMGGAAYAAVMIVAMLMLPPSNEVPSQFPAAVLWWFRLASLGTEAVLWATLGLVFGIVAERQLALAGGRGRHARQVRPIG
jgi:Probable cobalt transporter subunit (CbtA)